MVARSDSSALGNARCRADRSRGRTIHPDTFARRYVSDRSSSPEPTIFFTGALLRSRRYAIVRPGRTACQLVVKIAPRTESGEAPRWQGATTEKLWYRERSNAANSAA